MPPLSAVGIFVLQGGEDVNLILWLFLGGIIDGVGRHYVCALFPADLGSACGRRFGG